jgi:hypothetical protein
MVLRAGERRKRIVADEPLVDSLQLIRQCGSELEDLIVELFEGFYTRVGACCGCSPSNTASEAGKCRQGVACHEASKPCPKDVRILAVLKLVGLLTNLFQEHPVVSFGLVRLGLKFNERSRQRLIRHFKGLYLAVFRLDLVTLFEDLFLKSFDRDLLLVVFVVELSSFFPTVPKMALETSDLAPSETLFDSAAESSILLNSFTRSLDASQPLLCP